MAKKRRSTPPDHPPWLHKRAWDLLFVLGTPLFCLGLVGLLKGSFSSIELWIGVMALGAMGHHFPGFLRAYTDPELFARFRTRFLLAPPLLFSSVFWFTRENLYGMALVVALWGTWHGMMQHYGFMRIYDGKIGGGNQLDARWDFALCLAWFGSFLFWSPGRVHHLLSGLYLSGMPSLPIAAIDALPDVASAVTFIMTFAYIRRLKRRKAAGQRVSLLKLALCAGTFAFLAISFVLFDDLLLGLVAWELYHDIQYLAIVWLFNRKVCTSGGGSVAMKRLFRSGPLYVVIYVLLCLIWGTSGFSTSLVTSETARHIAVAFVATSGLLHFYYDGFIWKLRDPETRAGLGISSPSNPKGPERSKSPSKLASLSADTRHAVAWCALIAFLYGISSSAPQHGSVAFTESIAAALPDVPEAALDNGVALRKAGRYPEAARRFEQTLSLDPFCVFALNELGILRNLEGRLAEADELFSRARRHYPNDAPAWNNGGVIRAREGHPREAEPLLRQAVRLDPMQAAAWNNLAAVSTLTGRHQQALSSLERALEIDPKQREALANRKLLIAEDIDEAELADSMHLAVAASERRPGPGSGRRCSAPSNPSSSSRGTSN